MPRLRCGCGGAGQAPVNRDHVARVARACAAVQHELHSRLMLSLQQAGALLRFPGVGGAHCLQNHVLLGNDDDGPYGPLSYVALSPLL